LSKVADFGLSRELNDKQYYSSKAGNMAIKWTAPEALTMQKFSHQSDVWSFGICLYELFSRGRTPYFNFSNSEAAEKVVNGYRMEKPMDCPDGVYNIMMQCWEQDPRKRIKFSEIVEALDELITKTALEDAIVETPSKGEYFITGQVNETYESEVRYESNK